MRSWLDEYPHKLHANVLLLDNKIECWKTGNTESERDMWSFKASWKVDRRRVDNTHGYSIWTLGDYTIETNTWIVNNAQEHREVFEIHAPQWYRQWEHADDYKLGLAYE